MLHKVFVYGTLKSDQRNNRVLGSFSGNPRKAIARGIVLHGEKGGLPFAVRGDGRIYGEVYEVDTRMLATLDRFERHPHWYVRELTMVELLDGGHMRAWIYLNQDARLHPRLPRGVWRSS